MNEEEALYLYDEYVGSCAPLNSDPMPFEEWRLWSNKWFGSHIPPVQATVGD